MAKTTHDRQLERARNKRRQDALAKRRGRSRLLVIVLVTLVVLSLVGFALVSGRDGGSPVIDDEPGAASDADQDPDAEQDPDDDAGQDPGEDPGEDPEDQAEADGADGLAAEERPDGACPPTPDDVPEVTSELYDDAPEMTIDESATYTATIATTCGEIVAELDAESAPVAVNNFVFLAEEGYYDGVIFHRVIDGFMVQGGDPAGTGCGLEDCAARGEEEGFPGYTIPDELEAAAEVVGEEGAYPYGSLAMAKTMQPDTGGSQFFIVEAEEGAPLPPDYTLFGRVIEGMDVVESIALGPTDSADFPDDPVVITGVTIASS